MRNIIAVLVLLTCSLAQAQSYQELADEFENGLPVAAVDIGEVKAQGKCFAEKYDYPAVFVASMQQLNGPRKAADLVGIIKDASSQQGETLLGILKDDLELGTATVDVDRATISYTIKADEDSNDLIVKINRRVYFSNYTTYCSFWP